MEMAGSTFVDGLLDAETRRSIRQMKVGKSFDWTQTVELAQARTVCDYADAQSLHSVGRPEKNFRFDPPARQD